MENEEDDVSADLVATVDGILGTLDAEIASITAAIEPKPAVTVAPATEEEEENYDSAATDEEEEENYDSAATDEEEDDEFTATEEATGDDESTVTDTADDDASTVARLKAVAARLSIATEEDTEDDESTTTDEDEFTAATEEATGNDESTVTATTDDEESTATDAATADENESTTAIGEETRYRWPQFPANLLHADIDARNAAVVAACDIAGTLANNDIGILPIEWTQLDGGRTEIPLCAARTALSEYGGSLDRYSQDSYPSIERATEVEEACRSITAYVAHDLQAKAQTMERSLQTSSGIEEKARTRRQHRPLPWKGGRAIKQMLATKGSGKLDHIVQLADWVPSKTEFASGVITDGGNSINCYLHGPLLDSIDNGAVPRKSFIKVTEFSIVQGIIVLIAGVKIPRPTTWDDLHRLCANLSLPRPRCEATTQTDCPATVPIATQTTTTTSVMATQTEAPKRKFTVEDARRFNKSLVAAQALIKGAYVRHRLATLRRKFEEEVRSIIPPAHPTPTEEAVPIDAPSNNAAPTHQPVKRKRRRRRRRGRKINKGQQQPPLVDNRRWTDVVKKNLDAKAPASTKPKAQPTNGRTTASGNRSKTDAQPTNGRTASGHRSNIKWLDDGTHPFRDRGKWHPPSRRHANGRRRRSTQDVRVQSVDQLEAMLPQDNRFMRG